MSGNSEFAMYAAALLFTSCAIWCANACGSHGRPGAAILGRDEQPHRPSTHQRPIAALHTRHSAILAVAWRTPLPTTARRERANRRFLTTIACRGQSRDPPRAVTDESIHAADKHSQQDNRKPPLRRGPGSLCSITAAVCSPQSKPARLRHREPRIMLGLRKIQSG